MINDCCKKPEVKTLHEMTGNKVCLSCGQHWYEGMTYTRRESDIKMDDVQQYKERELTCGSGIKLPGIHSDHGATGTTASWDGSITLVQMQKFLDEVLDPKHEKTSSDFLKPSSQSMAAHFGDLQIVEVKPKYIPVLQIRFDVPLTDEFRADMNAWLLGLFGRRWQTENEMLVKVGQVIRYENTVMMRTETYEQVKAHLGDRS